MALCDVAHDRVFDLLRGQPLVQFTLYLQNRLQNLLHPLPGQCGNKDDRSESEILGFGLQPQDIYDRSAFVTRYTDVVP